MPQTCATAEPFALRVTDDSMAPEFAAGMVVIVDPSLAAEDGDFVVASIGDQATLGCYRAAAHGARIDVAAQSVAVSSHGAEVLGVVVQRAGRRRAAHKHYRRTS